MKKIAFKAKTLNFLGKSGLIYDNRATKLSEVIEGKEVVYDQIKGYTKKEEENLYKYKLIYI